MSTPYRLFTDKSLDAVIDDEIPHFQQLAEIGRIKLVHMDPLESSDPDALSKFIYFWHRSFHIAHFACHAFAQEDDSFSSYIQLSNDYHLKLNHLITYEFRAIDNPLVILNACHTGVINSLSTLNFAQVFLRCGARGVIATECEMPDLLAAQFTNEFFKHLLNGNSLGESLILTRYLSWKHNKIATPLLYAMYAPESIRLLIES